MTKQIITNLTKDKQIFAKEQKTEIERILISHYFEFYTVFYHIHLQIYPFKFVQWVQYLQ